MGTNHEAIGPKSTIKSWGQGEVRTPTGKTEYLSTQRHGVEHAILGGWLCLHVVWFRGCGILLRVCSFQGPLFSRVSCLRSAALPVHGLFHWLVLYILNGLPITAAHKIGYAYGRFQLDAFTTASHPR